MKTKKIVDHAAHGVRVEIDMIQGDSALHDYGLPRTAWARGVKLMKIFGSERALDLIDQRAERAADRGDFETARRWRDLIAAIHAIEENERLLGDQLH
jgi:hypothetical protein